jgi:hypothetical protein
MPEPTEADASLVEAVRGGAVGRFGEIVRRHAPGVRGVVARNVRDRHEREEAVQQTFYLALRHLDALADPARLASWLGRIARRVSIDRTRARAHEAARTRRSRPRACTRRARARRRGSGKKSSSSPSCTAVYWCCATARASATRRSQRAWASRTRPCAAACTRRAARSANVCRRNCHDP